MTIESIDFTDSDNKTILLFQRGDKKAFGQLYDQFAPLLFSVIFRIVENKKNAELALTKSFLKIWQHRKSYCPQKGCISIWLMHFAREAAFSLSEKNSKPVLPDFDLENAKYCSEKLLDMILIYGKTQAEICLLLNISQEVLTAKLKSAIQISHSKI